IAADRMVWSSSFPAYAFTNRYTVLLPAEADPSLAPNAYGYGSLLVKADGKVTLTGAAADTFAFTHKGYVSRDGRYPLFAPFYPQKVLITNLLTLTPVLQLQKRGALMGCLSLSNATAAGDLNWF